MSIQKRIVRGHNVLELAHMRAVRAQQVGRQAADAFEIVRGGIEQMTDPDERDHKLAQQLCGAHEALVARKERAARQGGSQVATEAVATIKA